MMNYSHVLAKPKDSAPFMGRMATGLYVRWRNRLAERSTTFNENDSQSGDYRDGEVQFRFLGGASRS